MIEWIQAHHLLLGWLAAGSVLTFVATLTVVPLLVVRIPHDYFARDRRRKNSWDGFNPVLRLALLITKNVMGYIFVIAGIAMLVLPGQGLITIFIGITLLDFPGKYHVERWAVMLPAVLRCINWLRKRADRRPLVVEK